MSHTYFLCEIKISALCAFSWCIVFLVESEPTYIWCVREFEMKRKIGVEKKRKYMIFFSFIFIARHRGVLLFCVTQCVRNMRVRALIAMGAILNSVNYI